MSDLIKIIFEDHGQDVTSWTLNSKGMVIDSNLQPSIWTGSVVKDPLALQVGVKVLFIDRLGKDRALLYPVAEVRQYNYHDLLINEGNVQDIRCSLGSGGYSIEFLEDNIEFEMAGQNRSAVIRMLQAKVNKKRKHRKSVEP